jgi:hypothetical protein
VQVIRQKIGFRDAGSYGDMRAGPNQFLVDDLTLLDSNQDKYYAHTLTYLINEQPRLLISEFLPLTNLFFSMYVLLNKSLFFVY